MIAKLKQALKSLGASADSGSSNSQSLKLATAFLLIEVGKADHAWEDEETGQIIERLAEYFQLPHEAAEGLLEQAHSHADDAVSLYDTVELINQRCQPEEKREILLNCWRVAFADGFLDKHEEHLIRQLSEWLYLSHQDFIQLKHQAEQERVNSSPTEGDA